MGNIWGLFEDWCLFRVQSKMQMSASMLKQNLKNYQTNTMVETKQKNCYPIPNKVKICKQMIFIMTIPSQSTKYILKVYLYYITSKTSKIDKYPPSSNYYYFSSRT